MRAMAPSTGGSSPGIHRVRARNGSYARVNVKPGGVGRPSTVFVQATPTQVPGESVVRGEFDIFELTSSAIPVNRCRLAVKERPPDNVDQAALMIRRLRSRVDARPNPCLFSNLTLVTVPSAGPVDQGSFKPFTTAARSA